MGLENEFGPKQVCQWLGKLGYEMPADAADLEDLLAAVTTSSPIVMAQVKKAKDSDLRNVTVLEVIASNGAAQEAPAAAAAVAAPAPAKPAPVASPKPTPKSTPVVKKPAEAASLDLAEGMMVIFSDGSTNYTGKIVAVESDAYNVEVGEDVYAVPKNECAPAAAVEKAEEEAEAAEAAEETAEAAEAADEQQPILLAFCQAHDIECTEDSTSEALKESILKYEFKEEELVEDEVKLLKEIGGTIVRKPAAKATPKTAPKLTPKPVAKPAPKAPAKPAPRPAGKKK